MGAVKNRLLSVMRRMMISCEEASMLASREMLESISMKQKANLHMHIVGCKHCRKYHRQTAIIHKTLRDIKSEERLARLNGHRLSGTEKSSLQRLINNKIQSS